MHPDGSFIGVTGAYPSKALWNAGYNVCKHGKILGEILLQYRPPNLPIPETWKKEGMTATLDANTSGQS
jgi:hypothetical protein